MQPGFSASKDLRKAFLRGENGGTGKEQVRGQDFPPMQSNCALVGFTSWASIKSRSFLDKGLLMLGREERDGWRWEAGLTFGLVSILGPALTSDDFATLPLAHSLEAESQPYFPLTSDDFCHPATGLLFRGRVLALLPFVSSTSNANLVPWCVLNQHFPESSQFIQDPVESPV